MYKVVALTRLVCPEANIPSTTALATINKVDGREQGLQRGANIVMPNLTPPEYRVKYEIYPDKACVNETAEMCRGCLHGARRVHRPRDRQRARRPQARRGRRRDRRPRRLSRPGTRQMRVLTVNAGSSSLKLRVLDEDDSLVADARPAGAARPRRLGRSSPERSTAWRASRPSGTGSSTAEPSSATRC